MSDAIAGLEPEGVWRYFAEISAIPRCSKNEERIAEYVLKQAEELGLEARHDKIWNTVVEKPASAGREKAPKVCLQGHLDMVCEKNKDVDHDFDQDPIELVREDNVLRANGTTLGADNGIAVATCLAIMSDDSIEHGPLEFLFTVDEETGLTGAGSLESGFVESDILLNLDSEDEGVLFVGCAGGKDTTGSWKIDLVNASENTSAMRVRVTGLVGGHSGLEIDKGRGNSIKILGRALTGLHQIGARIAALEGGNKRNAIPREAEALVFVPEDVTARAESIAKELQETVRAELASVDPDVSVTIEPETGSVEREVLDEDQQERILKTISGLPHGVIRMSDDIPGLPETSTNVAVIDTVPGEIRLETSQRSSIASRMDEIVDTVQSVFELGGAEAVQDSGYPGWKPNMDSPILKLARETYRELYGADPEVTAVHAGLECGIIGEKYPGMDMLSFGPTLEAVHSPDERIYIDSVEKFWNYLLAILKKVE